MENCPSHVCEVIPSFLSDARVCIITWTPHMTENFQELDPSLCKVLKRREHCTLPFDDDRGTAKEGQTLLDPAGILWYFQPDQFHRMPAFQSLAIFKATHT
jgi:hypothetical protein